jgi:hypothetical protein
VRRFFTVLIVLFLCGCLSRKSTFDYDSVYVRYVVRGGLVADDRHVIEYVVDNGNVSFLRRFSNGSVAFSRSAVVSEEEYRQLGRSLVDYGVFGMLEVYNSSYASQVSEKPEAELFVDIDGQNKTVKVKPLIEDYMPGNLQKAVSDVKMLTQRLQG